MPPRLPHPDPGIPDTRSPLRYAWWLARCQPGRVLRGSVVGTAWMVGLSVRPFLIARAVDDGLRAGDFGALLGWASAILVAGVLLAWLGILRHRTMTFVREDATARSAALVLRAVSRGGAVLARKLDAGEVATVGGSDIGHVSHMLTMTGPGVGAVIAYGAAAVVLWSVSPKLAMVVLLGVPAIAVAIGPLLRRLDAAESSYREKAGRLTARSTDLVAGLRVLAGVGGRSLFADAYTVRSRGLLMDGYRVGAVNSWVIAGTLTIPGLFLAAVVWFAARMAATGEITVGEMVAVYGYVAILVVPVWFLLEGGRLMIRGRVAARRVIALLNLAPGQEQAVTPAPPGPACLDDPDSGLRVEPGAFLAVAAADPADAVALADRLGRYGRTGVLWGGRPLAQMPLAQVRERILVDEHESYLFAGKLSEILDVSPAGPARDTVPSPDQTAGLAAENAAGPARVAAALHAASAEDIVRSLPQGLHTLIAARARNLSGGQRQRIRLARALLAEPEVLILLDPTSAVDAHTEARIAARLRAARAGRTTVVLSTSPLLLGAADTVAHLRQGRVVSTGTHPRLLETDPAYRSLVSRETEQEAVA